MQVITIDEGDAGEAAINLDLVTYARFYRGKEKTLILHFAGEEKNRFNVGSAAAGKVWTALTRN